MSEDQRQYVFEPVERANVGFAAALHALRQGGIVRRRAWKDNEAIRLADHHLSYLYLPPCGQTLYDRFKVKDILALDWMVISPGNCATVASPAEVSSTDPQIEAIWQQLQRHDDALQAQDKAIGILALKLDDEEAQL